jgi:chemotaxis protein MotB
VAEEKKTVIVIKKVYEENAGGHHGAWKVAFADFMTAMMCFFLVMWLLNQSDEVKAQVASYFTGPSMLEHEFTSYGAELTLEKMFLDLVNEPLKTVQDFMQPADFTPNLMAMGSKRIVLHEIAEELGPMAKNVQVESDKIVFEIQDKYLFKKGTAEPSAQFVDVMTRIETLTKGLDNSTVEITSTFFVDSIPNADGRLAKAVNDQRLDLVKNKISTTLEHGTVDIIGAAPLKKLTHAIEGGPTGSVTFEINQKDLPNGRKPRPLEQIFGKKDSNLDVYNDFVRRVSEDKNKDKKTH